MAQHMLRRLCLVVTLLVTLMSPADAVWKRLDAGKLRGQV